MSAKITLVGSPQGLRTEESVVTFRIITGPASSTAPKGLPLFKAVTYVVQCTAKQFRKGHVDDRDRSELIIEGYQEPRLDENGKPYIAVIATSLASKRSQVERKLAQLRDETVKVEEVYEAACDERGVDSTEAQAALAQMEKVKANLVKFLGSHPEVSAT